MSKLIIVLKHKDLQFRVYNTTDMSRPTLTSMTYSTHGSAVRGMRRFIASMWTDAVVEYLGTKDGITVSKIKKEIKNV